MGRITNIGFNQNIAEYIANKITEKAKTPTDILGITLIVPTQRFAYTLKEQLTSLNKVSFMPQILTVKDLETKPLIKDIDVYKQLQQIKPKHQKINQTVALYRLIKAINPKQTSLSVLNATETLEKLIDDAALNNVDLKALEELSLFETSEHFRQNLEFLKIVYKTLPSHLEVKNMNALSRIYTQEQAIKIQTKLLNKHKPKEHIIAVGLRSLSNEACKLLKTISTLENGEVIFYGLDYSAKDDIQENNPQFVYQQMLKKMGITTKNIEDKTTNKDCIRQNIAYLSFNGNTSQAINLKKEDDLNINLIECQNIEEESLKIALLLKKEFIKNQKSCLVTHSNELASRVETRLKQWGINPNNSIGNSLLNSKNASFFTSGFSLFFDKFNIINFTNFVKHPLASFGKQRINYLKAIRAIDKNILRVRKDIYSIKDINHYVNQPSFINKLDNETATNAQDILKNLVIYHENIYKNKADTQDKLKSFISVLEACSENSEGKLLLFSEQEGESIKNILTSFTENETNFKNLSIKDLYAFIVKEIAKTTLRQHHELDKSVAIMSPLESYMLSFNKVVLGGMNDDLWPKKQNEIPWVGAKTIKSIGLSSKEQKVGNDALFFVKNLCNNNVVITRSVKSNNSSSHPSRFIKTLQNTCSKYNLHIKNDSKELNAYYKAVVKPDPKVLKYNAIYPKINHKLKTEVSATALETWYKDPFAFFVQYILNIKQLGKLHSNQDNFAVGNILHSSLEEFIKSNGVFDENKEQKLHEISQKYLKRYEKDKIFILKNINKIKEMIASSISNITQLINKKTDIKLYSELSGGYLFKQENVFANARLDFATLSENVVNIIDFKTGKDRNNKRVQLALIHKIMQNKGFNEFDNNKINSETKYNLNYWFLAENKVKKEQEIDIQQLIKDFAETTMLEPNKNSNESKQLNPINRLHEN